MYIPPFVLGILATLVFEVVAVVVAAIVKTRKRKGNE